MNPAIATVIRLAVPAIAAAAAADAAVYAFCGKPGRTGDEHEQR